MLLVAIILAIILLYIINFSGSPQVVPPNAPPTGVRRVGGPFAYNDISDESMDHLMFPINTVTGPGGGSLVKNYV